MDYTKIDRVLSIYSRLLDGAFINKTAEAVNFGVNERSIQRDIDDIRNYLEKGTGTSGVINSVVYDRIQKAYRLEQIYQLKLTNGEILAICKILLDSRALLKEEMSEILNKLISCCVPEKNQRMVKDMPYLLMKSSAALNLT